MKAAKIIEISDKVMVEYMKSESILDSIHKYTVAEVENIDFVDSEDQFENHLTMPIIVFNNNIYSKENRVPKLNQQVFIEPTTEGKCKIVKLNQ